MLDLEFHQLELHYESLRRRNPRREAQILASLAGAGQLMPIVVVAAAEKDRFVVVDGYKRVRALRRLGHDTVVATLWDLGELEALLLERLMRGAEPEAALEQGWLLRELSERFGLGQQELARRFDRTTSWVSRRLALVGELPSQIQDHVREGSIPPHAAMKHLVPLARANEKDCVRLASKIADLRLSTRDIETLYNGYRQGKGEARERLLADPGLYLRTVEEAQRRGSRQVEAEPLLLADLAIIASVARRAWRREFSRADAPGPVEVDEVLLRRRLSETRTETDTLFRRAMKVLEDAGPGNKGNNPQA